MEKQTFTINLWGRYSININKSLIPIKIALFFWFSGARTNMVFIPVYVKHQGLSIKHFSTLILLSVCLQFLVNALSGILQDKIGRVKPFLFAYLSIYLLTLTCFTILPKIKECSNENITFNCTDEEPFHFEARDSCQNFQDSFHLDECLVNQNRTKAHGEENSICPPISIGGITIEKSHLNDTSGLCLYQAKSKNLSDTDISPCGTQNCKSIQLVCSGNKSESDSADCNYNRMVWIVVYYIVVILADVFQSAAHRCFDVIVAHLSNRHKSDYGKQRLWGILGTSVGPSLAGLVLSRTTSVESGKNYTPIFVLGIIFSILSIFPIWNLNPEFHKPATQLRKKSLGLMNWDTFLFLLLILTGGVSFSFQMMFGNWYLQNLGASDLLIGISKGISILFGLPFLYASKWFYAKMGVRIYFVVSLLCYVFYAFAFSLMREPWLAMGLELANIFAYLLFWPAVIRFCEEIAPLEMQATVKNMAGVLHFSIGKIGASMIGGYVMNTYGGRTAYQVIGYITLGYTAIYGIDLVFKYLHEKKSGIHLKRSKCETAV